MRSIGILERSSKSELWYTLFMGADCCKKWKAQPKYKVDRSKIKGSRPSQAGRSGCGLGAGHCSRFMTALRVFRLPFRNISPICERCATSSWPPIFHVLVFQGHLIFGVAADDWWKFEGNWRSVRGNSGGSNMLGLSSSFSEHSNNYQQANWPQEGPSVAKRLCPSWH